jgi:hypothetical protein
MKRSWEKCPRGEMPGRWAAPYVTMNPEGEIVLSRYTHEAMKGPDAYVLLFDRQTNTIGLNPSSARSPDAYPAHARGKHGGRVVRAYRLMQRFRVEIPETVRFVRPEIDEDGVLLLDLRTARSVRWRA